ncbi:MAG: metal-dependent hydrolase [Saezia sp.]
MTTIITHMAIPLLARVACGKKTISNRLLCAGLAVSILPDLDVVMFKFGVAYANQFGHRGASHSLLLVLILALLAMCFARSLKSTRMQAFLFVGLCALSHSVLDALTRGGLGVGWLWPWDQTRYLFPYTPIEASPFNPKHFLEMRGIRVLISELIWVWLPLGVSAILLRLWRKHADRNSIAKRLKNDPMS